MNDNLACFQHLFLYFICGIYFDDSDCKYRDKIRRGVMKITVIIAVIIIFIWVGIKINRKCNKNNVVQKHRRNSSWTAKLFDLSASLVALHLFFVSFKPFFYRYLKKKLCHVRTTFSGRCETRIQKVWSDLRCMDCPTASRLCIRGRTYGIFEYFLLVFLFPFPFSSLVFLLLFIPPLPMSYLPFKSFFFFYSFLSRFLFLFLSNYDFSFLLPFLPSFLPSFYFTIFLSLIYIISFSPINEIKLNYYD